MKDKKQKLVRVTRVRTLTIKDYKIANYFLLPLSKSEVEDMVMKNVNRLGKQ